MSEIDAGGPAFPTGHTDTSGLFDGMTLRDYFAAHASAEDVSEYAMMSVEYHTVNDGIGGNQVVRMPKSRTIAEAKYAYADDMISARDAKK